MKRKETKREVQLAAEVELLKSSCMNLDQAFQRACSHLLDQQHAMIQLRGVLVRARAEADAVRHDAQMLGRMVAERDLELARLNKQIELQQLTLKGLEQYTWGKNTRVEQTITVPA